MADPVQQPDKEKVPPKAAPKAAPKGAAPKGEAPAAKQAQAKPKEAPKESGGKLRLDPLNVNLGRTGLPQESALPVRKAAPKGAPKPAPKAAAKPAPKAAPEEGGEQAAKPAAPAPKAAPAATQPVAKKAAPREKKHYFILENLCVGCGLCLDKCPPKVNAIGYKFYGDVQEGGFRCYIDQDACISCSACFSGDECPSGALVEVLPDGQILDFSFTPPERLDFDLRFLHRFHREVR
ncbi:MAG: 4Fe-4S dicluster domain-containing protein [Chlorobiaceae bacterium]|nr:4Fe-4S dicluster domain-containing protein [Chlorobiaceae bacterium]